jgi:gliding motility-associated-like protein
MLKFLSVPISLLAFSGNAFSQNSIGTSTTFGFIENKGQIIDQHKNQNAEVLYILPAASHSNLLLKKNGFSYDMYDYQSIESSNSIDQKGQLIFNRLDVEFVDANPNVKVTASSPANDYLNYYTTHLSNNNGYQTRHFQKIVYSNLYPGIDLIFYSNPKTGVRVKYDFVVHPGADLSQVKMKYSGYQQALIENDALIFSMGKNTVMENIPSSWWQESGEKTDVHYELIYKGENELIVGLKKTESNPHQTLIVDPEPNLNWATYYGDTLTDIGTGIITDNLGFIYSTGITQSFTTLATSGVHQDTMAGGFYDVYVTKFADNSVRLWSTYYGGSGMEKSNSIIVDTLDKISITGFTDSPDGIASDSAFLETINSGTTDAFVAKFDNNGLRLWSTYFGGEGEDSGNGIDTDFDGFIFVTGTTSNSNSGIASTGAFQPSSNGMNDAFLVKFDTLGYPIWSTYFGGSADDYGYAVSEESGSIFITGKTSSSDLITSSGAYQNIYSGNDDAFITAFSSTGILKWSTFFGGPESDQSNDIEIFNSKIYCTGTTKSDTLIAETGAWSEQLSGLQDAFIIRLDTVGTKIWSTYFGKSNDETGVGISIELDGGIYITGSTWSDSLATSNAHDTLYSGSEDVYLAKFYPFGTQEWCSYYGASGSDVVAGVDVFGNTSIYLTGYTNSTDSISNSPSFQADFAGGIFDAFIARFTTYKSTTPCSLSGGGSSGPTICEGDSIYIFPEGGSLGTGANWVWYENGCGILGGGTQIYIGDTLIVAPLSTTTYFVRAESINNASDCGWITISVVPGPIAEITLNDSLCQGTTLFLNGSGGANYAWTGPNGFSSSIQNPFIDSVSQIHTGDYILTVDNNVCADTDSAYFFVFPSAVLNFTADNPTCATGNDGSLSVQATGAAPFTYFWQTSGSTDSTNINLNEGVYYVTVTDSNNCVFSDSAYITDPSLFIVDLSSTISFCNSPTGSATNTTSGINSPYEYLWNPSGDSLSTAQNLYPGWHTVTVTNNLGCIETDSVYVDSLNNLVINATTIQNETCVDFSDGSAQVQIISGTPPFDYLWFPSDELLSTADSLSPGDYFVMVVDSNTCQQTDTVTILEALSIIISTENIQDPTCGFSNGFIEVSAAGGSGVLTYFWGPINQSGSSANDLDSGQYSVTVTDQNNCEASANFTLTQTGIFDVSIEVVDTALNEGDSTQFHVILSPGAGVYSFYWSPEIVCVDCQNVQVTPITNTTYTVYVTNEFGCVDTAQIFIGMIQCIDAFVPTIFSPNGDGLNDEWVIFGSCIEDLNLRVFDRWGELIFTSTSQAQPWDGTYKNQTVPLGNYTYQLELRLKDNSVISNSGIITVAK